MDPEEPCVVPEDPCGFADDPCDVVGGFCPCDTVGLGAAAAWLCPGFGPPLLPCCPADTTVAAPIEIAIVHARIELFMMMASRSGWST